MAVNPTPTAIDQLFALSEDMADGAAANGQTVGLLQNTEARIRADMDGARAAQQAYLESRNAKTLATAAQRVADSNGRAFIGTAKNVLTPSLGSEPSPEWSLAGFVSSLAIPKSIAERMSLLGTLRDYFTSRPQYENAPLNVTAAQAGALFTALSDARSASNASVAAVGQARVAWSAARATLERRVRGLIDELEQLISPDDPVWYAFGLNPPAADQTPSAPEGPSLIVHVLTIFADWDDVPNAERYRVLVQIDGIDADFRAVESPTDSDATLGPFLPGQTVRVKVTAVRGNLESAASEVATIVIPELEAPTAA
ncbi:MAG: hypothetical protein KDA62_18565 [Planctomycetales bacterium]|nr:hypothetical protein [Planctomycetales bacterium]